MPEDAHPDESDGEGEGARRPPTAVRPLPPKPETPAERAAAAPAPDAAAAVTAPAESALEKARQQRVIDPGPPPPLPADLVIPPKPPLPPIEFGRVEAEPVEPPAPDPEVVEPDLVEPSPVEPDLVEPDLVEPSPVEPDLVEVEPEQEPVEQEAVEPEFVVLPGHEAEPPPTTDAATPAEAAAAIVVDAEAEGAASLRTDATALVVKGVTKAFGDTRAVDGIDLTVPAGIFYGLVGPNGAGKTTTLSMIAGLLRPDRGSIRVNGVDAVSDPLGAKRQMGVLPDRLRTFDRLTGRQLLHYYGVLRGLPSAVVESRTTDLARAFDLSESLGRVVSDYSAGMVKKVMLAGALIHSPRLLVLDEPFEAVDPVSSAIILDILKTYVAHGGTVILSSHGMDLVERVCSRVAVIVAGQVLAEGTVDEVRGELTLEQRFIELAGGLSDVEGLEWLHTFSD
jgi:ABC-2 type transport system ATP-binding protein